MGYEFVGAVLRLFADALAALWGVSVFRFFLAFALLAVVYGLCRQIYSAAKSGVTM
jgi:hypothetical protein